MTKTPFIFIFFIWRVGGIQATADDIKPTDAIVDSIINEVKSIYKTDLDKGFLKTKLAFNYAIEIRYDKGLADCNYYFGHIYSRRDMKDSSLFYFKDASKLYSELGIKKRFAQTENNIGRIYYLLGEFRNAYHHYGTALKTYQNLRDRKGVSISLMLIGLIFKDSGDYDVAIGFFLKSLDISEEIDDSVGIAYTSGNLGNLFSEIQDYQKAFLYTNQSISIFNILGDQNREAITINNLGDLHQKVKNYDEALKCFNRAARIHDKLGNLRGKALSLNNIAYIYIYDHKYQEAIDFAKEAYQIYYDIGEIQAGNNVFLVIAKGYIGLKKYESALNILNEGVKYVNVEENILDLIKFHELFCQIFELQGNYLKASQFINSYTALHDSVFNEATNNQIFELHESYSSERKETENQYLREEQGLQNKLISAIQNQRYFLTISVLLLSILIMYMGYLSISNRILGDKIGKSNANLNLTNNILEKANSNLFVSQAELSIANEKLDRFNKDLELKIVNRTNVLKNSRFMLARLLDVSTGYLNESIRKLYLISGSMMGNHEKTGQNEIFRILNIVNESDDLLSKLVEINEIGRKSVQIEEIDIGKVLNEVFEEKKVSFSSTNFKFNILNGKNHINSDYRTIKLIFHNLLEISLLNSTNRKIKQIDIKLISSKGGHEIVYGSENIQEIFTDNENLTDNFKQDREATPISVLIIRKAVDHIGASLLLEDYNEVTNPEDHIRIGVPYYKNDLKFHNKRETIVSL